MTFRSNVNNVVLVIIVSVFLSMPVVGNAQTAYPDVPEKIKTKAKYLFYLHGAIIETQGIRPTSPKHGVYEYEKIVETFKNKGFIVISEARKGNIHSGRYAQKIALQVDKLLKAGVLPSNITVVGASKGGFIAMQLSTILNNDEINYVLLACCVESAYYRYDIALAGNVLSIYDEKDEQVISCKKFIDKSPGVANYKEIVLKVGTGHGFLYKPIKEWVDPAVKWAKGKR